MARGFLSLADHEHSDRSAPGTRHHGWRCIMAWDGLAWPGSLSFLTAGGARYRTFGRLQNPRRLGHRRDDLPCPSARKARPARSRLRRHSPTTLEVVRDYCAEQTKGTRGTFHEFRRAWIQLVVKHINDAKTLEWRLYHGITGKSVPNLANYELPLEDETRDNNDNSHKPKAISDRAPLNLSRRSGIRSKPRRPAACPRVIWRGTR
jgi:hypothetical protein